MPDDKKLIIDEDWKSQVEAEKRQAEQASSAGASAPESSATDSRSEERYPPATFELLLTTLATEALMSLGQVPNPINGRVAVHREQARYLIDTIELLQQKTKGNLTPQEQLTIDNMLHHLRMTFVASGQAFQEVEP